MRKICILLNVLMRQFNHININPKKYSSFQHLSMLHIYNKYTLLNTFKQLFLPASPSQSCMPSLSHKGLQNGGSLSISFFQSQGRK